VRTAVHPFVASVAQIVASSWRQAPLPLKSRGPASTAAGDVTIFDLLFVLLFLAGALSLIGACISLLRGRRTRAFRLARGLAVGVLVYLGIVAVVGIGSPQVVRRLREDQCSDDWCIAVDSIRGDTSAASTTYDVDLRLSSRARRTAQRERFVVVYVLSESGQRFDATPDAAAIPFDTLLQAGETIHVRRRFAVPPRAGRAGVVVAREGGYRFPGCCIIGDESSVFHKHAITPIQ